MNKQICWVEVVDYPRADASLKRVYDEVRSPGGNLDNLYQAFSLCPQTISPADQLYRSVLHHDSNRLPKWFAELIGTQVALTTGCQYALTHHQHNFRCLFGDQARADEIIEHLVSGDPSRCGTAREVAALRYSHKLCTQPDQMVAADVDELRQHGWDDGEVVEIVQVVAMFSYFVRVINGLGVSLEGDRIGFY